MSVTVGQWAQAEAEQQRQADMVQTLINEVQRLEQEGTTINTGEQFLPTQLADGCHLFGKEAEIHSQVGVWPHSHETSDTKVIIQGDSEHALVAVISRRMRTDIRNTTHLTSTRTVRLDLLGRTNVGVGSDLPIRSWMVRHAAWLLCHIHAGTADGKTACMTVRKTPRVTCATSFSERVLWNDPTLQPAKLRSSQGRGLRLGRSQTSNAHLIGTRLGIVVRTIRRLPTSERDESSLVVHDEGTRVAERPASDAQTVTKHAVKQREVIVVLAISGAPLHMGSGQGRNPVRNLLLPTVAREQSSLAAVESSQYPSGDRGNHSGLENVVLVEVAQHADRTTKSQIQRQRG